MYRQKEGAEHLHKNYDTFDDCIEIFKQGGIVLIFSEAMCENEWHLRPIKKGTARLAFSAWEQDIPLQILPVAINYSSFHFFGKNIHLYFGSFITKNTIIIESEKAKQMAIVTKQIEEQLSRFVYEIDKTDKSKRAGIFTIHIPAIQKILLALPAGIGILVHFPLFMPVEKLVSTKSFHSVHYDSIMIGMLFLLYPVYLLTLCILTYFVAGGFWWIATLLTVPFFAWSYLQLRRQIN